jgi:plastocyanin
MFRSVLKIVVATALIATAMGCLCWQATSAATLTLTLTDQNGAAVDDAVLYVTSVDGKHGVVTPINTSIDQIAKMFVPHVRAVSLGSRVSFPNSDPERHQVYSFSGAKTFELPLYTGVPPEPVEFDKAGLVILGCNIHDSMLGYILVLDTPWYAEVRAGKAVIKNLPAGKLAVEIWHPRMMQAQPIQLNLAVTAEQNASINQQLQLKPERMVNRAPHPGSIHY